MSATRIIVLPIAAAFAATTVAAGPAGAAPADFAYKDGAISAALFGAEDPTAAHPTIDLISAGPVNVSGHDILTYRGKGMEPLDASVSLYGDWLDCDTATDELVHVLYNGGSALREGSVTVDARLIAGSISATWPVDVTLERTPGCAEPSFEPSTSQAVTGQVAVEVSVVSDGSPPVTSSVRDPSMGSRSDTTYQSGVVTVACEAFTGGGYRAGWRPSTRPRSASGSAAAEPVETA